MNIKINGISYSGDNISITNNKIVVNGKDVTPIEKEINISIDGDVDKLKIDFCNKITVNGNVGDIKSQSGNFEITGDVNGSIKTMSGNIKCNKVKGSVSTMSGNINHGTK